MTTSSSYCKAGLLATGDEIALGDILNTNAQHIAQQLTTAGFLVGNHIVTTDTEDDIQQALLFLLQQHEVVIITGGLGPTSDDRTRFALSKVIQQPLIFDKATWENIVNRFTKLNIPIHESNRQQALFPAHSQIIPNPNGSAAGCVAEFQGKLIFLLPGPPQECLPMFEQNVLPALINRYGSGSRQVIKWRLFGVIEANIAALLDELTATAPCTTGYRIDYPYLEVKIYVQQGAHITALLNRINEALAPYQLNSNNQKALQLLIDYLMDSPHLLRIQDHATAGYLESKLVSPALRQKVIFNHGDKPGDITVHIQGLTEVWSVSPEDSQTSITINMQMATNEKEVTKTLPLRQYPYTVLYAVEVIAWELYQFLQHNNS